MKISLAVILVLVVVLVTDSDAVWFGRNRCGTWFRRRPCTSKKCAYRTGSKPFYFGTTNLWCILKGKKGKRGSSPSRPTWQLSHRWIQYDDHYFERLKNGDVWNYGRPADGKRCSNKREGRPAGYSTLSVDCIIQCTKHYEDKYDKYHWLTNNCHDFANRISHILCSYTSCPSWCST